MRIHRTLHIQNITCELNALTSIVYIRALVLPVALVRTENRSNVSAFYLERITIPE